MTLKVLLKSLVKINKYRKFHLIFAINVVVKIKCAGKIRTVK